MTLHRILCQLSFSTEKLLSSPLNSSESFRLLHPLSARNFDFFTHFLLAISFSAPIRLQLWSYVLSSASLTTTTTVPPTKAYQNHLKTSCFGLPQNRLFLGSLKKHQNRGYLIILQFGTVFSACFLVLFHPFSGFHLFCCFSLLSHSDIYVSKHLLGFLESLKTTQNHPKPPKPAKSPKSTWGGKSPPRAPGPPGPRAPRDPEIPPPDVPKTSPKSMILRGFSLVFGS